jgi:hypothetical protein
LRQDRFGAPSDKAQNEEGGPHQSLHRVLHEKSRASSRAAQTARFDCTRYSRLTLPVADEASARLSDVVVFMRCVPLLIMIRNVALAMVTEVFTPVEVARNARLENTVEVHEVGGRGVDSSPDRIPAQRFPCRTLALFRTHIPC